MSEKVLLTSNDIETIINDCARRINDDMGDPDNFAIVGVQTRGVELARRIKEKIEAISGKKIKNGILDITFHRDDLSTRGILPVIKETRISFDISKMNILLVDDVIFTGRSTKAALETLTTFGRPSAIKLFVLVDRGNRETPIQPDYCGHYVETGPGDNIKVLLKEIDGVEDLVLLVKEDK